MRMRAYRTRFHPIADRYLAVGPGWREEGGGAEGGGRFSGPGRAGLVLTCRPLLPTTAAAATTPATAATSTLPVTLRGALCDGDLQLGSWPLHKRIAIVPLDRRLRRLDVLIADGRVALWPTGPLVLIEVDDGLPLVVRLFGLFDRPQLSAWAWATRGRG
jgi:hypothetical protein